VDKQKILNRPVRELAWRMSPAGIGSSLMLSANAIADAVFAGQFVGSAAMAGIALSVPLIAFHSAIVRLVGTGSASILSRAIGSGNEKIFGTLLYHAIGMLVLCSLCISLTGYFFAGELIGLMGGTGDVLHHGSQYYRLMALFCLPSIFGVATSVLIRAEGRVGYAMRITATGVALNLILCPIFCGYLGWEVAGTAFSTIIAMSAYSALTFRYFLLRKGVLFFGKLPRRFDIGLLRNIMAVGLPGFQSNLSGMFRQVFLFRLMALHGADTGLVVFSAIYRTFSFSVAPTFGIVQALQPVAGMNHGAKQFRRTRESYAVFLKYSVFLMAAIALPLLLFPEAVLSALIPDVPLSGADVFHFRLLICVMLLFPVFPNSVTFLQAIGKSRYASWMTIGRDVLLFYPMVAACWFWAAADSLYYGIFLENAVCALLFLGLMAGVLRRMEADRAATVDGNR